MGFKSNIFNYAFEKAKEEARLEDDPKAKVDKRAELKINMLHDGLSIGQTEEVLKILTDSVNHPTLVPMINELFQDSISIVGYNKPEWFTKDKTPDKRWRLTHGDMQLTVKKTYTFKSRLYWERQGWTEFVCAFIEVIPEKSPIEEEPQEGAKSKAIKTRIYIPLLFDRYGHEAYRVIKESDHVPVLPPYPREERYAEPDPRDQEPNTADKIRGFIRGVQRETSPLRNTAPPLYYTLHSTYHPPRPILPEKTAEGEKIPYLGFVTRTYKEFHDERERENALELRREKYDTLIHTDTLSSETKARCSIGHQALTPQEVRSVIGAPPPEEEKPKKKVQKSAQEAGTTRSAINSEEPEGTKEITKTRKYRKSGKATRTTRERKKSRKVQENEGPSEEEEEQPKKRPRIGLHDNLKMNKKFPRT